jgi:hypothetical protein
MSRTYEQARTLADAGVTEISGYNGGRTRRVCFEHRSDHVAARLFQTNIVEFHPDKIIVSTGGWNTQSTFDGIAAALGIDRARVGTVKRVPYCNGKRLDQGPVVFTYEEL